MLLPLCGVFALTAITPHLGIEDDTGNEELGRVCEPLRELVHAPLSAPALPFSIIDSIWPSSNDLEGAPERWGAWVDRARALLERSYERAVDLDASGGGVEVWVALRST